MLRTLSLATLGVVALAVGPAFAMTHEPLVVHVPFAFTVENQTLPAGDYRIQPLSDLDRNVLEIRSTDGRHGLVVLTWDTPGEPRGAKPRLVFDRYGDKAFLRGVEVPDAEGAALPASPSEVQAARGLASLPKGHRAAGS